MQGSLQFTENFETDELATYLDIAERVDECSDISGTEKYPGFMLGPCYENVTLPDDIFQLLREYYRVVYNSQQPIGRTIMQFGRLCISSEVYVIQISTIQNDHTFEQNF